MHHDRAMGALWDALADFPVHALVVKTGIIYSLLNVVGSTHTQNDIGTIEACLFVWNVVLILFTFAALRAGPRRPEPAHSHEMVHQIATESSSSICGPAWRISV